jgi:tRNA-splicing ligase RtcB
MELAGAYAYAGRDWVCHRVAQIVGAPIVEQVHNHHNFAWRESVDGQMMWVVRKGATPAFPGQQGFIGGSMGENAVIVQGVDHEEAQVAMYSTIHGAGRMISRSEAKGKVNRRGEVKRAGTISREMMMEWVQKSGVCLRGAGVDESPHCYKRLPEVLDHHKNTIKIIHVLKPIGVAMAGPDIVDPYKD